MNTCSSYGQGQLPLAHFMPTWTHAHMNTCSSYGQGQLPLVHPPLQDPQLGQRWFLRRYTFISAQAGSAAKKMSTVAMGMVVE